MMTLRPVWNNTKLQWKTGVRYAHVAQLKESIVHCAKLSYDWVKVSTTAWHFGQTHMKCRWHSEIVLKDYHNCNRATYRNCFSCCSKEHFKAESDQGKHCYKCGTDDHLALSWAVCKRNTRAVNGNWKPHSRYSDALYSTAIGFNRNEWNGILLFEW